MQPHLLLHGGSAAEQLLAMNLFFFKILKTVFCPESLSSIPVGAACQKFLKGS